MERKKRKKKAADYFHHPEFKFNCAQAITYKWGCSENHVAEMRKCGGGRANNGNCGALHGALTVLKEEEHKKEMLALFSIRAGSNRCKEIKQIGQISCHECVNIADQLLQELKVVAIDK